MILETIHNNKRTLGGVLIISVVALMMTGFGLNSIDRGLRPKRSQLLLTTQDRIHDLLFKAPRVRGAPAPDVWRSV